MMRPDESHRRTRWQPPPLRPPPGPGDPLTRRGQRPGRRHAPATRCRQDEDPPPGVRNTRWQLAGDPDDRYPVHPSATDRAEPAVNNLPEQPTATSAENRPVTSDRDHRPTQDRIATTRIGACPRDPGAGTLFPPRRGQPPEPTYETAQSGTVRPQPDRGSGPPPPPTITNGRLTAASAGPATHGTEPVAPG